MKKVSVDQCAVLEKTMRREVLCHLELAEYVSSRVYALISMHSLHLNGERGCTDTR